MKMKINQAEFFIKVEKNYIVLKIIFDQDNQERSKNGKKKIKN